jgi:hypothetical protein
MVRAFGNRKGKPYRLFWIMPPGATASPATSYPVRNFPTTTPAVKPYRNLARISLSERKFEAGLSSVHIVAALALESDGMQWRRSRRVSQLFAGRPKRAGCESREGQVGCALCRAAEMSRLEQAGSAMVPGRPSVRLPLCGALWSSYTPAAKSSSDRSTER